MFLEHSRYYQQPTVQVVNRDGSTLSALKLRKLPAEPGQPHTVQKHDQLDVLAQQKYSDGTKFWHIADANTELRANDLVGESGRTFQLPEQ
jgi:hypothetical protein